MSGFSAAKISGCGEQHADGPAGLTFDAADEVQPFLVLGVGAVAEVEPQDVSAGVKESADGAKVRAGGGRAWRLSWRGEGGAWCPKGFRDYSQAACTRREETSIHRHRDAGHIARVLRHQVHHG